MYFEPIPFTLKDGRAAIFRAPRLEDAAAMLAFLKQECSETEFLLRSSEECETMTVEQEARWIEFMLNSPDVLLLVCEVDGELAGNSQIAFNHRTRLRHAAEIGIGIQKKFWGQGIGSAMFLEMEKEARRREGVIQIDLDFIEGNSRARGLYEKMGFRVTGMKPDAIMLSGGPVALIHMTKKL